MKLLHKKIKDSIKDATNLNQISKITLTILKKYKNNTTKRIGYVSGIVTSDGEEKLKENISNLNRYTKEVRKKYKFPTFSSTDIFDEKIINDLEELKLPPIEVEKRFWKFWRNILGGGYVTDIFMTPGWERSNGSQDEYKTAQKVGLTIHYV